MPGCGKRLQGNFDKSLLSKLMGIQCLVVHEQECSCSPYDDFGLMTLDTTSLYIDNIWLSGGMVSRNTIFCKPLIVVSFILDVKSQYLNFIIEMLTLWIRYNHICYTRKHY
jgi:hypothetical protein